MKDKLLIVLSLLQKLKPNVEDGLIEELEEMGVKYSDKSNKNK